MNANREIEFRAPLRVRHYRLLIKFSPFSSTPSLLIFWRARAPLCFVRAERLFIGMLELHGLQLVNRSLAYELALFRNTWLPAKRKRERREKKKRGAQVAPKEIYFAISIFAFCRECDPLFFGPAWPKYPARARSVARYYQNNVPLSF